MAVFLGCVVDGLLIVCLRDLMDAAWSLMRISLG